MLLVLCKPFLHEHFHGVGSRELPLMASEQAWAVFLLPTAQVLSFLLSHKYLQFISALFPILLLFFF